MRRSLLLYPLLGLFACGAFSSKDDAPPPAPPGEAKANENAVPPIEGAALDGIFVSSSKGDDSGDGTQDRPLRTLTAGMQRAKTAQKRLIACAEDFQEALVLIDGVSMYGYFDCVGARWVKTDRRAAVRAPTSPAISAQGLILPTRLEGFDVFSPDLAIAPPVGPGASSIGVVVRDAKGLTLSETRVKAGSGGPGEPGTDPAPMPLPGAGVNGSPADDQGLLCSASPVVCATRTRHAGPPGGRNPCAFGPPGGPGGDGGDGAWFDYQGTKQGGHDWRGKPLAATAETSRGSPTEAGLGDPGRVGQIGTDGAIVPWSFDAQGAFIGGDGTNGTAGAPGIGGGGGGGRSWYKCPPDYNCSPTVAFDHFYATTGAGGGAGGCGGVPGTAGRGGGASIALVSLNSELTVSGVLLEASPGGLGGKGSPGTLGGRGGIAGDSGTWGGRGGGGGDGGGAGLSGHGATGPSIALAVLGKTPAATGLSLAPGTPNPGQPELTRISGQTPQTMPAAPGKAIEVYEIKP